jgi:hypothetical protein
MNKEDTLKQICKMISSGDIPKVVYDKYLSKTQLGFMNYEELYDFLMNKTKKYEEVIDKIQKHCEIEINASNYYLKNHNSQKELCHKVAHQIILDILKEVE